MLNSPAATSDSSGFSERAMVDQPSLLTHHGPLNQSGWSPGGWPPAGITSLPGHFRGNTSTTAFSPGPPMRQHQPGSPGALFGYHNPTLMASPYSTLPRRAGGASAGANATVTGRHSPALMSRLNNGSGGLRGTPEPPTLLELAEPIGWPPSGGQMNPAAAVLKVSARTPLLEDDRESCV